MKNSSRLSRDSNTVTLGQPRCYGQRGAGRYSFNGPLGVAARFDGDGQPIEAGRGELTGISYYAWNHRGPGWMAVWCPGVRLAVY